MLLANLAYGWVSCLLTRAVTKSDRQMYQTLPKQLQTKKNNLYTFTFLVVPFWLWKRKPNNCTLFFLTIPSTVFTSCPLLFPTHLSGTVYFDVLFIAFFVQRFSHVRLLPVNALDLLDTDFSCFFLLRRYFSTFSNFGPEGGNV